MFEEPTPADHESLDAPAERTYDGFHVVLVLFGVFVVMLLFSFWLTASAQ